MTDAPERRLWQAVIYQACVDALSNKSESENSEKVRARREADSWIRGAGRDFREVCSLAGLDPDFISEAYVSGKLTRSGLRSAAA